MPLPVGRVEVQDVTLKHERVGALLVGATLFPRAVRRTTPLTMPLTDSSCASPLQPPCCR